MLPLALLPPWGGFGKGFGAFLIGAEAPLPGGAAGPEVLAAWVVGPPPAAGLAAGPPLALVAFAGELAAGWAESFLAFPLRTVNCLNRPGLSWTWPVETLISMNGLAISLIVLKRFWCSSADS